MDRNKLIERITNERNELNAKMYKLAAFVYSDRSSLVSEVEETEYRRLVQQLDIMESYSRLLGERLKYHKSADLVNTPGGLN